MHAQAWVATCLLATAAAAMGNELPQLMEAKLAFERGQYAVAQKQLMFPAEMGDPEAQELLGLMYAFGPDLYPGTYRDPVAGAAWLARAGINGRPAAQHMYCALARRLQPERKLGLLQCFDDYAEPAVPHAATQAASPAKRTKRTRQAR